MELQEALHYASERSTVIRQRKNLLYTFGSTRLPYVCLSECPRNAGDILLHTGQITAEPPKIALPGRPFQFEGFDLETDGEDLSQILIARRIAMPPAKYTNKSDSVKTAPGPMDAAVERTVNRLDQTNDSRTAVIAAPHEVWNLSVLLYAGSQVIRSASSNVAEHIEHLRLQGGL